METNLYRIIQEALSNVAKHADANNVWLNLSHQHPKVKVLIEDDGKGFDPVEINKKENGLGLVGLKERIGLFKGNFVLDAAPGKGSRINIEMNIPV
jgi:signal transduction histidine kinase